MAAHLRANARLVPGVVAVSERTLLATTERETRRIERIASMLAAFHGSPDLGNKHDPVDELVYIALSRRTRERAYQAAFEALRQRWPTWEEVADASLSEVTGVIRPSGLGERKATSIVGTLAALRDRFGSCRLDVEDWPDERVHSYLASLPEIGPKSAACVMAMALGRHAFAVDVHVGRVLGRIAPYRSLGLDVEAIDHKRRQALLPALIPPLLRRDLHINLLCHGRAVCRPRSPRCEACCIQHDCLLGRTRVHPNPERRVSILDRIDVR